MLTACRVGLTHAPVGAILVPLDGEEVSQASAALRKRMGELRLNQYAVANAVGKSRSWVAGELLKNPDRIIRHLLANLPDEAERLMRTLDYGSLTDLSAGLLLSPGTRALAVAVDASQGRTPLEVPEPSRTDSVTPVLTGFVREPIRDLASAGLPDDPHALEQLEWHLVPDDDWHHGIEVYRVTGDSMTSHDPEESIREGDLVYVDTRDTNLLNNRKYVIRLPGDGVLLKRVRVTKQGPLLFSDNPNYEPLEPSEAIVIGRVTKSIRERTH